MGAIIWIIIIIWVIVAVSKGKSQNQNRKPVQTMKQKAQPQTKSNTGQWVTQTASRSGEQIAGQQTPEGYYRDETASQRELKARLMKKYNRQTNSGILERAKASVEEDFGTDQGKAAAVKQPFASGETMENAMSYGSGGSFDAFGEKLGAEDLMASASGVVSNELLIAEMGGDMMREIQDLMIKGPDTSIAFERDFVAEGLDLLNQIQV